MSQLPRVSTVLPVYNSEAYLAEAIESVLAQTYRPLELLIVDDGSTDGSAALAARYASAEVALLRQANRGTAAARNAGLAQSRGEVIAHLDADDVWLPEKLQVQVEALLANPGVDAACGRVEEFFSPELDEIERGRVRTPRDPLPGYVLQAMLVRRSAHERVGAFDTAWRAGQDLDWLLRAQECGLRFLELPQIVVRRRLHAANKGRLHPELARLRCRILKQALDRRRAGPSATCS